CSQDPVVGQRLSELFTNRKENINLKFSEDCLYLNIYTPADLRKRSRLPVMVWIHGGGLMLGGASTYDGLALSAHENVVVVTIQYRLGIWGFFSTGDEHSRGNWGHLDQLAALHWVQENIANFGGDPGSVTIFGESAGGESVSILVLSPLAKNLFHRAISESGVALTSILVQTDMKAAAKKIAVFAGCKTTTSAVLIHCLRQKTEDELLEITLKMSFPFLPTVLDGVLLPKVPEEILAEKNFHPVPYIVGINKQECGWILPMVRKCRPLRLASPARHITPPISGHRTPPSTHPPLGPSYTLTFLWKPSPRWPSCHLGGAALGTYIPTHSLLVLGPSFLGDLIHLVCKPGDGSVVQTSLPNGLSLYGWVLSSFLTLLSSRGKGKHPPFTEFCLTLKQLFSKWIMEPQTDCFFQTTPLAKPRHSLGQAGNKTCEMTEKKETLNYAGGPTYMYEFQYRPSFSSEMKPKTVIGDHGDELFSVFGAPFLKDGASEEETDLSKMVMKFWANFARNGNPNGEGLPYWPVYDQKEGYLQTGVTTQAAEKLKDEEGLPHWPVYDQKEGYLQIGVTTQAAEKLKDKEVAFWNELLTKEATKKPPQLKHAEL
ncbi:hypothetical protein E2I00_006439, partial [Balaenoptera physalus]